ncbi:hypothetical protein AB0N17_43955 [Streptomyces sp. NPDC051133]|uniref:hypothetical protein n=1 Tax=Streptomyces sp. NPDC051133 TaxID=3155521 RepID=UPI00341943A5
MTPASGTTSFPGGSVTITPHPSFQGPEFDFHIAGPYAARQVIVHAASGSSPTANIYTYDLASGFPGGLMEDFNLHAPTGRPTPTSAFFPIDSITFCLIPSPY